MKDHISLNLFVWATAILLLFSSGTASEPWRNPVGSNGESSNLDLAGRWAQGPVRAVASRSDTAFFGNGGRLDIVDFSTPSSPSLVATLDLPTWIRALEVSGAHLYIAADESELLIIDISDPSAPILAGSTDIGYDADDVAVSGDYAYVACGSAGIWVINI
ncbi:MAG: hypothetical protein GF417_04980, partial [Candidatus Latescibacteria bacterium]|nr:hypothetical protein [Candidatus Latescibacterota bacterium]